MSPSVSHRAADPAADMSRPGSRRWLLALGALAVPALVALTAVVPAGIEIVAKAAGIPSNATGIGGFVNGAKALVNPALVMVAAVAPLALITGGAILLFGGRSGMKIIGTALGVLLILGSVTALIN